MKTLKIRSLSFAILLVLVISLVIAASALAASKNYNGLTTVYYNNNINDNGGWNWNASYQDYTVPSRSMDQFGLNVWTAYCTCDGTIDYTSYVSYRVGSNPWLMQYNKTSIADGMALSKVECNSGKTLRGHNYIQHWWQDSGYSGDGATLSTSRTLSNP